MANWYIGQEIVCVKSHSLGLVVRGKTYTIKALQSSSCKCIDVEIDVGIIHDSTRFTDYTQCSSCNTIFYSGSTCWFGESLFAPIDQDISELTEILEQANVVKL